MVRTAMTDTDMRKTIAAERRELAAVLTGRPAQMWDELRADDIDWTFGSGTPMSGTAQDLAPVLCGRTLPAGRLRGEPSERFTDA
jgi:hypothetical protein